jgi:hypothetical protein
VSGGQLDITLERVCFMARAGSQKDNFDDAERVPRAALSPLQRAPQAYTQALTKLWLANAGLAIANLCFIATDWRAGPDAHSVSKILFVLGLVTSGLGVAGLLLRRQILIRPMEEADSMWQFIFNDWRTRLGFISAGFFVAGCVAAVFLA